MWKHLGLLSVFALTLFACASGDVTQGISVHSTVPVTARTNGSTSTSGTPTTTSGVSLTTPESSTTETTDLTTTPPTTTPPTTTPPSTTHNVSIGDKFFDAGMGDTSVTISVGDTVEWINGGDKGHTVTSGAVGNPDKLWDSGVLIAGRSFSWTFKTSGTFQYFCTIHGDKMEATVIVRG